MAATAIIAGFCLATRTARDAMGLQSAIKHKKLKQPAPMAYTQLMPDKSEASRRFTAERWPPGRSTRVLSRHAMSLVSPAKPGDRPRLARTRVVAKRDDCRLRRTSSCIRSANQSGDLVLDNLTFPDYVSVSRALSLGSHSNAEQFQARGHDRGEWA
jgi:hypothetical protein